LKPSARSACSFLLQQRAKFQQWFPMSFADAHATTATGQLSPSPAQHGIVTHGWSLVLSARNVGPTIWSVAVLTCEPAAACLSSGAVCFLGGHTVCMHLGHSCRLLNCECTHLARNCLSAPSTGFLMAPCHCAQCTCCCTAKQSKHAALSCLLSSACCKQQAGHPSQSLH
jgi:hypothetical protein